MIPSTLKVYSVKAFVYVSLWLPTEPYIPRPYRETQTDCEGKNNKLGSLPCLPTQESGNNDLRSQSLSCWIAKISPIFEPCLTLSRAHLKTRHYFAVNTALKTLKILYISWQRNDASSYYNKQFRKPVLLSQQGCNPSLRIVFYPAATERQVYLFEQQRNFLHLYPWHCFTRTRSTRDNKYCTERWQSAEC